jgi:hypothetical protein
VATLIIHHVLIVMAALLASTANVHVLMMKTVAIVQIHVRRVTVHIHHVIQALRHAALVSAVTAQHHVEILTETVTVTQHRVAMQVVASAVMLVVTTTVMLARHVHSAAHALVVMSVASTQKLAVVTTTVLLANVTSIAKAQQILHQRVHVANFKQAAVMIVLNVKNAALVVMQHHAVISVRNAKTNTLMPSSYQ